MEKIYDVIIVGGGPAGYSAALYSTRAGLDTLVIEGMSVGGQTALTDVIDNYPGFDEGIDGFTLGMKMQKGAERFGAETLYDSVTELALAANPKRVITASGGYLARTVIIATGANPRELGLPGERELVGAGVHYCAHCDGRFYRGKTVAVVGGGNSAAEDALYLSGICERVYLIHRRGELRASRIYHEPILAKENIIPLWYSTVEELVADGRLNAILVRDVKGGREELLRVDGLFVSIGRSPATELIAGQLDTEGGYIVADETTRTSIPGVFAAGDVRTKALRQVVTAAADGAVAAHFAEEYIALSERSIETTK